MENASNPNQGQIRTLKVATDSLDFEYISNGMLQDTKSIKGGKEYILSTYFMDEYPTEKDITKALNYIEYELTADKTLMNNNETLKCENPILKELLKEAGKTTVDRNYVEEVFNKYVDCSTGEPAHLLGIEFTKEKLAVIVVVRVVMYYLGFNEISIE